MSNIDRLIVEKKKEVFRDKITSKTGKKTTSKLDDALLESLLGPTDLGLSKKYRSPLGGAGYASKVKPTGAPKATPPRQFSSATTDAYQALLNSNNPSVIKWIDSRGTSLTINPKTSGGFASSKYTTPAPSVADPDRFGKEIQYG